MTTATLIILIVSIILVFALATIGVVAYMQEWDWGPYYMRVITPVGIILCLFLVGLVAYFEMNDREKQLEELTDTIIIDGQVCVPIDESKE